MRLNKLWSKLTKLKQYFRELWIPPVLNQEQLSLQETAAAREELLCLYSWYKEISSQDPHFAELVFRLLAAEKRYQLCLNKLRLAGISNPAVPYYPSGPRRGIAFDGFWYGW